jgi:sortase A
MRKRLPMIASVIALLVGAALVAYPYVSDILHKYADSQRIHENITITNETPAEDLSAEMAAAQDYNERLRETRTVVTDPFDPSLSLVSDSEYQSLLNIAGDGIMGTIYIPKISVAVPIYHGTDSQTLQQGVGHMATTSLPVGGESTHAVLAGHNGLPSMRVFDDLDQLEVGDYFVIYVLGEYHAYRVTSTEVVLPDDTSSLQIEEGKDLVTLVTCTPYGVNTHRLLVHAERCEVPQEFWDLLASGQEDGSVTNAVQRSLIPFTIIGLVLGLAIVLLIAGRRRRRRRHRQELAGVHASPKSSRRT